MFVEAQPTPMDLNWRMFGTPVRVNPFFWLIALLVGWSLVEARGLEIVYLLVAIACVFASLLVHELGHALAMRFYGTRSMILLYGFGGLTIPYGGGHSRGERIIISLAGAAAGFLFLGIIVGTNAATDWAATSRFTYETYLFLYWINLFWNVLNLLPVWPLDGGHVSREVFTYASPRKGEYFALGLSFIVAAVLAVHALMANFGRPLIPRLPVGGLFMALLFGLLAYESFVLMQRSARRDAHWDWGDDRPPWRR